MQHCFIACFTTNFKLIRICSWDVKRTELLIECMLHVKLYTVKTSVCSEALNKVTSFWWPLWSGHLSNADSSLCHFGVLIWRKVQLYALAGVRIITFQVVKCKSPENPGLKEAILLKVSFVQMQHRGIKCLSLAVFFHQTVETPAQLS